jgi:hypothetical protein
MLMDSTSHQSTSFGKMDEKGRLDNLLFAKDPPYRETNTGLR